MERECFDCGEYIGDRENRSIRCEECQDHVDNPENIYKRLGNLPPDLFHPERDILFSVDVKEVCFC